MSHDSQKKAVSLHFAGDNKRKVQVGYVVEAPIWKTSYRLVLDDKEKPYLQGWAMVENPTDEDWSGVKMALVSGRPISFKMDLYNPLYVDRPTVEPELFASLRPVAYRGSFRGNAGQNPEVAHLVRLFHELVKKNDFATAEKVANQAKLLDPDDPALGALANMAQMHKRIKEQSGDAREKLMYEGLGDAERLGPYVSVDDPVAIHLERARDAKARGNLDNVYPIPGMGPPGTVAGMTTIPGLVPPQPPILLARGTLSDGKDYNHMTESERMLYASTTSKELAARVGTGSVGNAATAAALGDAFQYAIDHPVNLARQKSAMLPIVGKSIEGQKVSIYNENVQRSHPLLGLKFKNTSGAHLNQGPITVFEGSVYAGDTRILDVQPNEERLVSYAIDLGTEVDPQAGAGTQKITHVKAVKGVITQSVKVTLEKKYRIVNRSQTDRTLLIEHPNNTNQQFKLVDTDKPIEDTPDVYRFQLSVKAGETKTFTVKEERDFANYVTLSSHGDDVIQYFTTLAEASPTLKQQLQEALKVKAAWDSVRAEQQHVAADLERLNQDQDRIRKNLRETPKEAEVYTTYLKKLSDQEKEIDALTVKVKKLLDDEFKARSKYDDFLANISD
jgi:hypothetical protein